MTENKKINELFEFLPKSKRNAKYGKEVGKYPFFASSNAVTKYVDEPDYTKNKLVIGDGGTASINYAEKDFSCSDHCYVLKPIDEQNLNCKYIFWHLYSNLWVLEAGFKGIGIKNISKTYIQNIEIPVPNKEEQDKIVSILDKADEIRTKKRLANDKLDEFLKSTFIDMFGDPANNSKNIPLKLLREIFVLSSGDFLPASKRNELGNYPVYGGNGITGFHDEFMFEKTKLCIGRVGVKCGCIHITKPYSWITDNALYVKEYKTPINETYLKVLLSIMNLNQYAKKSAQPQISQTVITNLSIIYPPIELQNKFAQIVEKVEAQKQKNEEVIEQMDNLFNSLSQRAFKGEL